MESIERKSEIRQLSISNRPQSSTGLAANLVRLVFELNANVIISYQPMPGEPDVTEFNLWAQAMGKLLLFPKIAGDDMGFASGELQPGRFDILEPQGDAQEVSSAQLILLPALAVDKQGNRLGKGSGYYDRALAHVTGIPKYAVVFDSELVDQVPAEPHDVWVTGAVTPTAIHHFRASAIS